MKTHRIVSRGGNTITTACGKIGFSDGVSRTEFDTATCDRFEAVEGFAGVDCKRCAKGEPQPKDTK